MNKNKAFVCGKLYVSIMNAQNLQNSENLPSDTYIQISI